MRILLIVGAILLSGCASSTQTYSEDGRIAYSLNCSGTARNWGMCYEKAGELCGTKGYDVLTRNGEKGASISGAANQTSAGIYGSTLHFRTMTIACKN